MEDDSIEPFNATRNVNSSPTRLLEVAGNSDCVIATANNEGSTLVFTTGKLFRILAKGSGLWNVHCKCYRVLHVLFIVLNVLSVATETFILTFCGPRGKKCVSLNFTERTHLDHNNMTEFRRFLITAEAIYIWNGLASTLALILLIHSLLKLQEKVPFMSIDTAQSRVSKKEWLSINVMLIFCVHGLIAAIGYSVSLHVHDGRLITYSSFGFAIFITYWTGIFCCSVFVVVSCAMNSLITECFENILKAVDGNLNTIIALHQQLRENLFSISGVFQAWFLVHWVMYGANCLSLIVFYSIQYSIMLYIDKTVGLGLVILVLTITIFVVPCVCASRVTWKCKELLYKINNRRLEDWDERHPFCERATLSNFILYAERSECGFRVGNFTFDTKGAWFSVLVGITGLVLKLLAFSKNAG